MIARRIRMNNPSKSSCVNLLRYLTDTRDNSMRVQDTRIIGCESDSPEWAAWEMQAVQRQNIRAKSDKTYHLVLSFRESESPTSDCIQAIEERICTGLGYENHQRVSVLHGDTDNLHLHIVINKIHPERLSIHEPYYDHNKLASLCVQLEQEFGLALDNHQKNETRTHSAAHSMEKAGDMESLTGWMQRECLALLKSAESWEQMHRVLADHGLELHKRGNGFVFQSKGIHVKASSVDRSLSKQQLETRLGPFQEAAVQTSSPVKKYEKKPRHFTVNKSELWEKYLQEREQNDQARARLYATAMSLRDSRYADARQRYQRQTVYIRYLASGSVAKRILHQQNRARLEKELKQIQRDCKQSKQACSQKAPYLRWDDWLRSQAVEGNAQALEVLRSRRTHEDYSNSLSGTVRESVAAPPDLVTKKGTLLYEGGVRDTGTRLLVPERHEAIKKGLELSAQKFRGEIFVEGSQAFKNRVVREATNMSLKLANLELEALRRGRSASPFVTQGVSR